MIKGVVLGMEGSLEGAVFKAIIFIFQLRYSSLLISIVEINCIDRIVCRNEFSSRKRGAINVD